jgi:hypothetical protein
VSGFPRIFPVFADITNLARTGTVHIPVRDAEAGAMRDAESEPSHADQHRNDPLAPAAVDLLARAISYVNPHLDRSLPVGQRLRALWAGVVAARDLAASHVVAEEFLHLAQDSGLAGDLGRHADDDLRHVIRWALLNLNPFK